MELPLECAFVPLPGVADRSGFTLDYSLQLPIVVRVPLQKNILSLHVTCLPCVLGLVTGHFPQVNPPQSVHCLML